MSAAVDSSSTIIGNGSTNNNSTTMTTTSTPPPITAGGGGEEVVGVVVGGGGLQSIDIDGPPPAPSAASFQQQQPSSSAATTAGARISKIDLPVVKSNIFGSCSNLVNSIVGAGIIGIPYAINEAGFIVGIVLLIAVSIFTDKTLRMIIELASFHPKLYNLGVYTFEDLMLIPYGIWGSRFIMCSMLILAYGAMIAYLLIIKDNVPTILGIGGHSFWEREFIMILTSITIMVPLSMMRDISQLSITSSLSVLADVLLMMIVIIYSPIRSSVREIGGFGTLIQKHWINDHLFIGLGVLSTAMACQHSAFLISGTLANRTSKRWSTVTSSSLYIAGGLSLILGVSGYLGYLDNTAGDVLNNFDKDSIAVNAGRALLAITMFFTYPMESFVARHVIVQLLYNGNMDNTTINPNTGEIIPEVKSYCFGTMGRRECITLGLYLATLLPAVVVDDLGPVLSLTGSLGASSIAYIAPGLVYLGINGDDFLEWISQSIQFKTSSPANPFSSPSSDRKDQTPAGANNTDGVEPDDQDQLPVAGDATAVVGGSSSAGVGVGGFSSSYHHQQNKKRMMLRGEGTKPIWWYLVAMPIWVSIASSGERGTRAFLTELGIDPDGHVVVDEHNYNNNNNNNGNGNNYNNNNNNTHYNDSSPSASSQSQSTPPEILYPNRMDYIYSILFIIFGVIAAVAGVASNIYIQLHDNFFATNNDNNDNDNNER